MDINKLFEDNGTSVIDDEALKRKEKIENSTSYMKMSEDSENYLRELAVKRGLIPGVYKNAEFSKKQIKSNFTKQQNLSGHRFTVENYEEYFQTCDGVISALRTKRLPNNSYVLGAPNGFGKQSFATDCILSSLHNGWITAPYISLTELAELKVANDKSLMRGLMGLGGEISHQPFNFNTGEYDTEKEIVEQYYCTKDELPTGLKSPLLITCNYSWSEFMNAPILVTFFTGLDSKVLESQIFYDILSIRSAKGYPTIAMTSTSMAPYFNDAVIGRHIWKEIISYDKDSRSYDRVLHVSCYKSYSNFINN